MTGPLAGKVALVTGASRGIGESIATALAAAGCRVALAARTTAEIESHAARIGNGAFARTLDVTDSSAVDRVVDEVAATAGGLDIVVNNAGLSERSSIARGSDEWFDRVVRANLTGTFYVCRAALRHLGEGGRVVNIASVLGIFGVTDSGAYVAAKHGVIGLTRALAAEVAPRGITVNALCPGWVETSMAERGFQSIARGREVDVARARADALAAVPIGRILAPSEVAELVVFLCGREARGIHGQAIRIDGGTCAW